MLAASIGKKHPAEITKTWQGDFKAFVAALLKTVPTTTDKANAGWICGATFSPEYRHGSNFVARHFVSLDYDHISPSDLDKVLQVAENSAFLAYTTWSHVPDHPRVRVWVPLSRPVSAEEHQAISRKVAARVGIDLAARESFTPAQFMYRPCAQKGIEFQSWQDTTAPALDADAILGEYDDWRDRKSWPRRSDEEVPPSGEAASPLDKPGIVGDFCRAFSITAAIERFGLPYTHVGGDRWTYTAGSRPEGAVIYDDDTKLHSHHDTDPASGQHNAFDLVRLHRFGSLDAFDGDRAIGERPSQQAMAALAMEQPEIAALYDTIWRDLDAEEAGGTAVVAEPAGGIPADTGVPEKRSVEPDSGSAGLPARIPKGSSICSDQENARRIQRIYGQKIISVGGSFYVWSQTHWTKDDVPVDRMIAELSTVILREAEAYKAKGDPDTAKALQKWAATCCSRNKRATCVEDLRSFLDFKAENLNAARHLLTCRSGTVDLRDGSVRPPDPNDFITSCAPTHYDPAARAPRFERFLGEIFDGDRDLISFAKRWFGYCITGEVREHAMLFHVGEGGNGKGKLMDLLQHVLGPGYAVPGGRKLLTSGGTGASPETVRLLGQRMVTLSETNKEEEFNEGVLKELTGGDRLVARTLYKDLIEFDPTHKLQVFTNHEPRIIGQDRGIWRRIFLLKYNVKFGRDFEVASGAAQRLQDDDLAAKLAAEAPGVLSWLIEGAREWYANGLRPPPAVRKATEDFRSRQDLVGQFLKERTTRDPAGRVELTHGTESLYAAYKGWVQEMGYHRLGRNRFKEEVKRAAPYADPEARWEDGGRTCRGFTGLRLKTEQLH